MAGQAPNFWRPYALESLRSRNDIPCIFAVASGAVAGSVALAGAIGCGGSGSQSDAADSAADAFVSAADAGIANDAGATQVDAGASSPDAPPFSGLHCVTTPCAVALAAGGGHVCALLDDHTVRCWGQNASGELGAGTLDGGRVVPAQTPTPTPVRGLTGVSEIATGGYGNGFGFSCAIGVAGAAEGGTVCWGSNNNGLLGLGNVAEAGPPPAQSLSALPLTLDAVQDLALGGFFGCALTSDGDVSCWGDDAAGELGRQVDAGSFDPQPGVVSLGQPAMAVATGKNHACALLADQSVACWGEGDHGAIGVVIDGGLAAPQIIAGLTATQLTAGEVSTCAVTLAGGVACWGGNQGGQLGRGDAGTTSVDPLPGPVALPSGLTALQIASAVGSTCALLSDRSVWCWGDNAYGELGTGSSVPGFSPVPARAQGLSNVVQLAAGPGGWTACALLDDGSVRCWGANYADQLGIDTSGDAGPDESPHPMPLRVAF